MQATNERLKALSNQLKQNSLASELIKLWSKNNNIPEFIFREVFFINNEWQSSYVNIDGELGQSIPVSEDLIVSYLTGSPTDQQRQESFYLDNFMRNLYTLLEPKFFYSSSSVPFVSAVIQFLEREVDVNLGAEEDGTQNLKLNNLGPRHMTSIPEAEFGRDPEELYNHKISANNGDKFYSE